MGAKNPRVGAPLHIDEANEWVWHRERCLRLTPKAFSVLRYLTERQERLVTKAELFSAVWPDTVVSDGALATCIREIRRQLGDEAEVPRYIETVHRRGYRFIGKNQKPKTKNTKHTAKSPCLKSESRKVGPAPYYPFSPLSPLVGREAELAQLHRWLAKARHGESQLVFVTGEAGIGKTTLVDAFLAQIGEDKKQKAKGKGQTPSWKDTQRISASPLIGRGQSVEHFGPGEAYLPVLEALGQLCRGRQSKRILALLRRYAPTWLVQMPWLLSTAELERLEQKTQITTRERMLRELAEALEAVTAETPLALVLEDLQWSDYSTLDLLTFLAQRRDTARLLLLGTYRPVDVIVSGHPLRGIKQELQLRKQCMELLVEGLTEADVGTYLTERFTDGAMPELALHNVARFIHRRTEGNALFMVNVVDALVAQEIIAQRDGGWELTAPIDDLALGVPKSIRQMIERHAEQLSAEERQVLEAASVVGVEFSVATTAAAMDAEEDKVEALCAGLARREHFLRGRGVVEWPDGTVGAQYGFLHALYQEVVYEGITGGKRIVLHRRVGERQATVYGERSAEIAAELAVHFEQGRDYGRAVPYLQQAAESALRRYAYQEAIGLLTTGLALVKALPNDSERTWRELLLQLALGQAVMVTKGYGTPEVEGAFARARKLCQQIGETPQLFIVLFGLWGFYFARAQFLTAHEMAEQLMRLARSTQIPPFLLEAHFALGCTLFYRGELVAARAHLEESIALYDPQQHRSSAFHALQDPGATRLAYLALALWLLGYPEQALKQSYAALSLARELSHPFGLVFTLDIVTTLHQCRREGHPTQEQAETVIELSTDQGFPLWQATGTIFRGWALAQQGRGEAAIEQIRQGLTAFRATGAELGWPYRLGLLAEAYGQGGQSEEGLAVLAEALEVADKTGEQVSEAGLHWLKGKILLARENKKQTPKSGKARTFLSSTSQFKAEAEASFQQAIAIARRQSAKSLELRATVSLSRLWQQQGKKRQARQMLAEIYNWFTEGFEAKDLQEARALLEELKR